MFQICIFVCFNNSSINSSSSSILKFASFVSVISSFISFLNQSKSSFLPLSCSINSSVNSGFVAFSTLSIFTSKTVSFPAKSTL